MDNAIITADQYFIYFSQIMGHPVMDCNGKRVGRFYDFSMALSNDIYPRAKGVIIKRGLMIGEYAEIPMADVLKINAKTYLKCPGSVVQFQKVKINCEFGLRRDVLDQQIVDVQNRKVERVNDVHLLRAENQYHIAHVDVGLRALIRRLDWEPVVDAMVRLFRPKADYLTAQELVSWKNSQVLTIGNQKNVLRLDVARAKIAKIPPTALADIMKDLDMFEQASLFRTLAFDVQLKVFADMAPVDKLGLVDQLDDREVAQIVTNIPSDEAADFLTSLPRDRMQKLLVLMESTASKRLRALLGFRKDSAGGLMATEFLSLPGRATVGDAINVVKRRSEERRVGKEC
jgi:magnesium transporter